MKTFSSSLLLLTGLLIFSTCREEINPLVDPVNPQLSFQLIRNNSGNDFSTTVRNATISYKRSGWIESDGKVWLFRKVFINAELENGEQIEIGFRLVKNDVRKDLLILEDEQLNYWERKWDFISFADEANQFYENSESGALFVTPYTVMFNNEQDSKIEITNVEKVMVNGKEKSQITMRFSGKAFGMYDPTGANMEWYKISDGFFRGIME